jgi:hypothetical protein
MDRLFEHRNIRTARVKKPNVIRTIALALALCAAIVAAHDPISAQAKPDPRNSVILTTKDSDVTIRLRPDLATKHVTQIKTLVKRKFYDGLTFHGVIPGFMAQTDDRNGNGSGRSDLSNKLSSAPAHLPRKLNTIRDVFGAVRACVAGAPFNDSPQELATTIRFSFTRDGHILGQPRFTYVQAGLSANAKQALKQMIDHALITCTPLSFTNGLGGAIAGRPFSIRIVKEPKAPSGVEHELTPGRHPP